MRVTGWILLIVGALLCATLVWATIGFLLMGIGLLSLMVAENNRKRANRADELSEEYRDLPVAGVPPPVVAVPPPVVAPPSREPLAVRREPTMEPSPPVSSYDREAWQQLVESDPDVARVAAVLNDYGFEYVDELAREYLAAEDKTRLAEIVDGIIGRAGTRAASRDNARPAREGAPANRVRRNNLMVPRADRGPSPPPVTPEIPEMLPEPAPVQAVAEAEAIEAPVAPPIVVEPLPAPENRNRTIVSADDELSAMLGRMFPDPGAPSKNR